MSNKNPQSILMLVETSSSKAAPSATVRDLSQSMPRSLSLPSDSQPVVVPGSTNYQPPSPSWRPSLLGWRAFVVTTQNTIHQWQGRRVLKRYSILPSSVGPSILSTMLLYSAMLSYFAAATNCTALPFASITGGVGISTSTSGSAFFSFLT